MLWIMISNTEGGRESRREGVLRALDGPEAAEVEFIQCLWNRRQYLRWNVQWLSCFLSPGGPSWQKWGGYSWLLKEDNGTSTMTFMHYCCAKWQLVNHNAKWKHLLLLCSFSQGTPSVWPDEGFKEPFALFKAKLAAEQDSDLKGGCWHSKQCLPSVSKRLTNSITGPFSSPKTHSFCSAPVKYRLQMHTG